MSKRLRAILGQIASFALAGVLLYLALRGVDFGEVGHALRTADYLWLIPLAVLTIVSHVLRSWRWQILLEELPTQEESTKPISLYTAFTSLIIGYFANYAAPRVGELVRSGLLARREKLSLSGVIGTVVLERILDVVILIALIVVVFFVLIDRADILKELFVDPLTSRFSSVPPYAVAAAVLLGLAGTAAAYGIWRRSRKRDTGKGHLRRLMYSFADGFATLHRTKRKGAIVVSTILMWACYVVMTHLPFLILGMTVPFEITLLDSFCLMILGAIGVAIPAPGGTGSYHYIAIQSLVHLFDVPQSPAATYAVLTHGAQLILYAAMGAVFLATMKASVGDIWKIEKETAEAVREETL